MSRDDATLLDILNAARQAVSFCEGLDRAAFCADTKTYFESVGMKFPPTSIPRQDVDV